MLPKKYTPNPLYSPLIPSSYAINLSACHGPEYLIGIIPGKSDFFILLYFYLTM